MKMTRSDFASLIDAYLAGIARGAVDDTLLTAEKRFWSVNSGLSDKARFQQGIALLAKVTDQSMVYTVESLIVEGDRASA